VPREKIIKTRVVQLIFEKYPRAENSPGGVNPEPKKDDDIQNRDDKRNDEVTVAPDRVSNI
jgi:hypothetical protein